MSRSSADGQYAGSPTSLSRGRCWSAYCPPRLGRHPDRTSSHGTPTWSPEARWPSSRSTPASAWPPATPGTNGSTRCTRPRCGPRTASADPPSARSCTAHRGSPARTWRRTSGAAARHWDCFGAPAALFCYIDRGMGPSQWSDVGMYPQTVMLLLRAEGLHSCTQMAWSVYRTTVAEILCPPDGLILFCGMSIGFEDPRWPTAVRAGLRSTRQSRSSRVRPLLGGRGSLEPGTELGPALGAGPPDRVNSWHRWRCRSPAAGFGVRMAAHPLPGCAAGTAVPLRSGTSSAWRGQPLVKRPAWARICSGSSSAG